MTPVREADNTVAGLIAVLLAALALAACGSDTRTFSDSDSEIRVEAGERFRIELETNPSVGDDWTLVGEPDPAVATLVDGGFESDAPDDVVGAPGTQYFLFEALAAGETEIVLEYCYRGCGGEGEELEHTEAFTVVVE